MAYRNKVYVAFDGDSDIHYYWLMKAWKQSDYTDFNFFDAHDLCQSSDCSKEETIKRSLKERLNNSKVFVLLVGESTRYLYKFVRWEIEQAIKLGMPLIVVNLNGLRQIDDIRCPPILKNIIALHISYNQKILQYALENWPANVANLKLDTYVGPYQYKDETYKSLGL